MKNWIVEFIGTAILVFSVGNAVASGSPLAPLAIGAALMIGIYAGGHVSGAHYNPAVSLAVFLRGKLGLIEMFFYWSAQVAGAILAGLLVVNIQGAAKLQGLPGATGSNSAMFIAELLWTFVLAWVVLNAATAKKNEGNSFYGLAIGFTVASGAVSLGGISGGVFNPAVQAGLIVMGMKSLGSVLLFWPAQLLGGLLAAVAFKTTVADQS